MSKNDETSVILKKRGRKPKQPTLLAQDATANTIHKAQEKSKENINVVIEETSELGLKEVNNYSVNDLLNSENVIDENNDQDIDPDQVADMINGLSLVSVLSDDNKPVAKKRGRKPKGGKIIQQVISQNMNKESKPNVILHLKCSLKDLHSNDINDVEINGFDLKSSSQLKYDSINGDENFFNKKNKTFISNEIEQNVSDDECCEDCNKENDIKEVWKKIKQLEHNLHMNNICDKKSACFWCTYDFDNPPVYIPKHYIKESYHVYGCFCSPECATAFLMEENIDSSSKFERYYLINHVYSKIYDYKMNIKPAPNPYYMLEKYYGNLTIQEYRALLRNERLFLIVDKPLTRILPELHEDNDDFIINNKIIPSNTYQFKKKLQKKQSKNNILSERFGLLQP